MALVVEDGTIVADADSYITRDYLIAYAAKRGVVLADADATDVFAIKAMDRLALHDEDWKGEAVEPGVQSLPWPRKDVYLGSAWTALEETIIPNQLMRAQAELAIQASKGIDLLPTVDSSTAFVKREKVDVIETEYSEAVALELLGRVPDFPTVDALIKPLLRDIPFLRTVRV